MDEAGVIQASALDEARRVRMRTPDEVAAMLALKARGWGVKRIAREFGTCPKTVRRYVRAGSWAGYSRAQRRPSLADLAGWLEERLVRHGGNADVVRQELAAEHGLVVSLRTVERACAPFRQRLLAAARATVRFETPPGRQLQIDFGERRVRIGGLPVRVHLFVATLGYSRRLHVRAFRGEAQESWFEGIEGAFQAFGGVPEEILFDNARALVDRHDAATREVVFNARLHAFARHWRVRPRACAPYRARTKGKDERGVGYVKRNAIAGRDFASWEALEAHLAAWTREVADLRMHGTTGEAPMARFLRDEAGALRPLDGTPPFRATRDLVRRVGPDCAVGVEGNSYSVPWRLIGERVRVTLGAGMVRISHAGREVATHKVLEGRRGRSTEPAHFEGVAGFRGRIAGKAADGGAPAGPPEVPALLRPLAEYEAVAGGAW
ncbi:IS21 family transposase [Sabulicella glaciei]|uniref:IS21 family transposase n=1 Tax=Sabulicella glaciei TaxID=2984948 RepID=UPI0038D1BAE9